MFVLIAYLLIGVVVLYGAYIIVDDWLARREEKAVTKSKEVKELRDRIRKLEGESEES